MLKSLDARELRQIHPSPRLWPAILALTIALVATIGGVVLNSPELVSGSWLGSYASLVVALAVGLLGLTLVPIIVGRHNDGHDWFALIYAISAAYALNFALRALYVAADPSAIMGPLPYWDTFALALTYVTVGFGCLLIGYYLPLGVGLAGLLRPFAFRWPVSPNLGKVVALYVVGFAARYVGSLQIVPISLQYYLIALGQCTSYAFAIAAIYSFALGSNTRRWRLFLSAMLPLQLVYAFAWGAGKFWLIEPVVIILICIHYLKRHLRLRAIALATLLIGALIYPLVALYRTEFVQQDVLARIARTAEAAEMMDWQGRGELIIDSVMRRSHLLDSLAVVVKYTATLGGQLGAVDYLLIPAYAFLPRAFWPSKPIGQGATFGMEFFGTGGGTSIGISNPADMYRHLGLCGIIGGMFVLGVLYRLAYEYLIVKRRDDDWRTRLPHLFIYVFVFEQFYLAFEVDLSTGLSEMLRKLLLLGLVAWYMRASPAPRLPQTIRS